MKIPYKIVISIAGTIVLLLQCFGIKAEGEFVNEIITGIAGLLVTFGVVAPEKKETEENFSDEESDKVKK